MRGEIVPTTDATKRYMVIKQPVGVCAAITPWNFPLAMITRKVAPALAAGCPVVIKPAEQTPLTALAAAELAQRAGMPAGVLNVITGDGGTPSPSARCCARATWCATSSFTGSTEVGRILMAQCAPTIKKLSLELGGNAPFLVFDDADIDSAVEGAIASKYRNAGQTCVCANRLYVQAACTTRSWRSWRRRSAALKVGNGFEAGVTQGPLIDDSGDREGRAPRGRRGGEGREGAGRRQRGCTTASSSRRCCPSATADMLCAREETFGPVAPVFRFEHGGRGRRLGQRHRVRPGELLLQPRHRPHLRAWPKALEYGMVGINTGLISTAEVPFGGVKQSGLGREGGHQGIDEYVETKYLCMGDVNK